MKLETRLRNRRRSAQLRDATNAREAELDELRSRLGADLLAFEDRRDAAIAEIPDWADVDRDEVAALFDARIDDDTPALGPRVVAYGAARVDTFVRVWLSVPGIDPDDGAGPDDVARWEMELGELRARLEEIRNAAREAASAAEKQLGEHLEAVLAALEDARESGEEVLLQGVEEGALEAGADARKKEASLWEEQRERAAIVRDAWAPLEELVFEGVDIAVAGLARLEQLTKRVAADMAAAYPELVDAAHPPGPMRLRKFVMPPPTPVTRDASSPSFVVDDARRVTEPMSAPYETEEFAREVLAAARDTEPPARATPPPLPEPEAESDPVVVETPPLRRPVRPDPTPTPARDSTRDETTHRIRSGWQPVRLLESAMVLGIPVVYTAVLFVATLFYEVGLVSNPYHASDVALPLWLGCAGCVFILPAILGWRVIWNPDWRPRFVRWQRLREDTVMRIDADGLTLGENRLVWDEASALLRKSSRVEPTWVLEVDAPHVHLFFAAEATANEWARRRVDGAPGVPLNAWYIGEDTLLEIARRVQG